MHEEHILFGARNIPISDLTSKMLSIMLIRKAKKNVLLNQPLVENLALKWTGPTFMSKQDLPQLTCTLGCSTLKFYITFCI